MKQFVNQFMDPNKRSRIYDIGSCDVNGSYRLLFKNPNWTYTGCDIVDGPNVDRILKREWQLSTADIIISGQCLEHVKHPWLWMKQLAKSLRVDGICCIIVPSTGELHRHPIDAWRFFPDGMISLAEYAGLEVVFAGWNYGNVDGKVIKDSGYNDVTLIARKP
jgi:hypothetical protein